MKRLLCISIIITLVFTLSGCGVASDYLEEQSSIKEIQDIVRDSQESYESKNIEKCQQEINKLIKISQDSLYSENERLIAQYCATFIQSGVLLDYLIKNDNNWVNSNDLSSFTILHSELFKAVINQEITNNETLKEYINGLLMSTSPIFQRYNEITGE